MYLSDNQIIGSSLNSEKPLIKPFSPGREIVYVNDETKNISHGLSQNGYDIRLGSDVEFFISGSYTQISDDTSTCLDPFGTKNVLTARMDPYKKELVNYKDYKGNISQKEVKCWLIHPGQFVLAHSLEKFCIPENVTGFLFCKSSYARLGMNMAPTVLKSGWEGQLVLEIYNQTNHALMIYEGCGIGTIYFAEHHESTNDPYKGKYHNQEGVVKAR